MAKIAEIFAAVRPDTSNTQRELDRGLSRLNTDRSGRTVGQKFMRGFGSSAGRDADREGKKVASRFGIGVNGAIGGIAAKGAGLFLAGFAVIKTAQVFKGFISEAVESQKVSRLTAQVIKTTGGAAKISAAQVGTLAMAISNKTGVDDEAIQSGANLLLTFKNVRNEVGRGNDIFNQATLAAVDLSKAGFGNLSATSKMLGKALNDPVKGMTALGRAGVTFTAQQKEQIQTLVESGNVLAAQKIIIKEVQTQVGGAAAATATPMEKLRVITSNLAEQFGTHLLPYVEKLSNYLGTVAAPVIARVIDLIFTGKGGPNDSAWVKMFLRIRQVTIDTLTEIRGGIIAFAEAWRINDGDITSSGFPGFMERLGFIARRTFDFFKNEVIPRLQTFAGYVRDTVIPIVQDFTQQRLQKLREMFGYIWAAIERNKPQLEQLGTGILKVSRFLIEQLIPFLARLSNVNLPLFGRAIALVIDGIGRWLQIIGRIAGVVLAAITVAWRLFSGFFQNILDGGARAFGWVPGIGGKLKNAAEEFRRFSAKVNSDLANIKDQTIGFEIKYTSTGVNLSTPSRVGGSAEGGKIDGPGTETSDSILRRLSKREWVIKAKSAKKYGDYLMSSVNAGTAQIIPNALPGFAQGGREGLRFTYAGMDPDKLARDVKASIIAAVKPVAQALSSNRLAGTVAWGKSQAGKPYVWGGSGPGGYDCSGFVSALVNYAQGRNPYRRLGATGSMPWASMAPGRGPFMIGYFKGNPGHTAATINGINFESAGGVGTRYGSRARGADHPMFTNRYKVRGFATGGRGDGAEGIDGDAPWDLVRKMRNSRVTRAFLKEMGIGVYDGGGTWPSGTLGANLSGHSETVLPDKEVTLSEATLRRLAEMLGVSVHQHFPAASGAAAEEAARRFLDALGRQ